MANYPHPAGQEIIYKDQEHEFIAATIISGPFPAVSWNKEAGGKAYTDELYMVRRKLNGIELAVSKWVIQRVS